MITEIKKPLMVESELLAQYVAFKLGKCSHLKLQKLLYYIQGFHLARFDNPIIDEDFEAWVHGPVLRSLWRGLKDKSVLYNDLIYKCGKEEKHIQQVMESSLSEEQIEWIDEVIRVYGKFDGSQLETLTHKEEPWIRARGDCDPGDLCKNIIPKEVMHSFFKSKIYG